MKKNIRFIITGIIILFGVYLYAHIGKTHNIYDQNVDTSQYKATAIYTIDSVEQEFECTEDYMDGIKLKCKLSGNTASVSVKMVLKEKETGETVAETQIFGEGLEESKFYFFEFDRINDCRGKQFVLSISEEGADAANYVDFCYTDGEEESTRLYFDGQEADGTMVIRTVTNRFDVETFCVLLVFVIYVWGFMRFLYCLFR